MGYIIYINLLVWNEKNLVCVGCYLVIYVIKYVFYLR